jgi:hypothetical protein
MAATATLHSWFTFNGPGGRRCESGTIEWDGAATTVEVKTGLMAIEHASFAIIGNAGHADTHSIDETETGGRITVGTNHQVTVDTTTNPSGKKSTYMFIGY